MCVSAFNSTDYAVKCRCYKRGVQSGDAAGSRHSWGRTARARQRQAQRADIYDRKPLAPSQ